VTEQRRVLLVAHARREQSVAAARQLCDVLAASDVEVLVSKDTDHIPGLKARVAQTHEDMASAEVAIVLGGDGTILRAAEVVRGTGLPLLGVNLGHVGFLAEAEDDSLDDVAKRVAAGSWTVEERLALDVVVLRDGIEVYRTWALNEINLERAEPARMLDVVVGVDGRPVSRLGTDGVLVSTPTGSTAYAFSAGGPVIWPTVEAVLVIPVSAHALFARPLVVAPSSVVDLELLPESPAAVLVSDGRRMEHLPSRARIIVRRSDEPVRIARLHEAPFTDRLVAKFRLPVEGWRGDT
jgi:NAD+ kinase